MESLPPLFSTSMQELPAVQTLLKLKSCSVGWARCSSAPSLCLADWKRGGGGTARRYLLNGAFSQTQLKSHPVIHFPLFYFFFFPKCPPAPSPPHVDELTFVAKVLKRRASITISKRGGGGVMLLPLTGCRFTLTNRTHFCINRYFAFRAETRQPRTDAEAARTGGAV